MGIILTKDSNPAARSNNPLVFVVTVFLVVLLIYSSSYTSNVFVQSAPVSGGHINCDYASSNDAFFEILTCCWWEDHGSYASYVCQQCREDGSWCGPIEDTDTRNSPVPPPPPGPGQGGPGNVLPLTPEETLQTDQGPVPKSGPGNLLPEGVFEGPTTSPEQGGMTPEVAPPTGPEDDNETQSRINTSPTGYCVPIRSPTCIPCDPGLPGSTCIPGSDWPPPPLIGTDDTGTSEGAEPTVPPTSEETAPQVAPPPEESDEGQQPTAEGEPEVIEEPQPDEGQSSDENSDN